MLTGIDAIEAASRGADLYVLNPQTGWVLAGPGTLDRARRMALHSLWIYGVRTR